MKQIIHGDSREVLAAMERNSLDCCVCDPPYHLTQLSRGGSARINNLETPHGRTRLGEKGFMGKTWDGGDIAQDPTFWAEVFRVLKPGGSLLAFGGTRTHHRMVCAIEDAGFEIRDTISYAYCYGSGFPKSHSIANDIDKLNGMPARGHAIATASTTHPTTGATLASGGNVGRHAPQCDDAKAWDGWGTALKPAFEPVVHAVKPFADILPIVMARKPLAESSVARNVLAHGTGGINIDACRIATSDTLTGSGSPPLKFGGDNPRPFHDEAKPVGCHQNADGRWPANFIISCNCCGMPHDHGCPVAELDAQSGVSQGKQSMRGVGLTGSNVFGSGDMDYDTCRGHNDDIASGASRFFFTAKPSRKERGENNTHPTVKPISLMRYLVRLVCPPGGTVLDPFAGSGSTAVACEIEGFGYVAIEREAEYVEIARGRTGKAFLYVDDVACVEKTGQTRLFIDLGEGGAS